MEVHKHPHHVTHKKKWTEYLLEFFMLFLAVFLGFVAENVRENSVERHREKEYMLNLLQDLRRDTATLSGEVKVRLLRESATDSLIHEIDSPDDQENLKNIYQHAYILTFVRAFTYSNSTVSQLKSSGALHLITKRQVADTIIKYDLSVELYLVRESVESSIISDYRRAIAPVLDGEILLEMSKVTDAGGYVVKPEFVKPLLTKDAASINQIKSFAAIIYYRNRTSIFRLQILKTRATNLIELIRKEYHLENE